MIDVSTSKPLRVLTFKASGPYMRVSFDQFDEIRGLLDRQGIRYHVPPNWLSFNGGPEMGIVRLVTGIDAVAVQAILDADH